MTLSPNINNREFDKFCEWLTGETAVRVCAMIEAGEINIKAPTGPFLITTVLVTDTVTAYPGTPLPDRVSLTLLNESGTNLIYFGPNASVTADIAVGTTSGWRIRANGEINIDLDAGQTVYFVCETGKTAIMQMFEIAST